MHCNSHLSNAYFSTVIEPQQWLYQCSILAANLLWDRKWTAYLYPSLTSRPCLDGFFIFYPIIKNNKVSCEYGTLMWIIINLLINIKIGIFASLLPNTSIDCLLAETLGILVRWLCHTLLQFLQPCMMVFSCCPANNLVCREYIHWAMKISSSSCFYRFLFNT